MGDAPIPRRAFLEAGIPALAFAALPGPLRAQARDATETRTYRLRLKETAGLRRFGYPVHAVLPGPPDSANFRLERDGRPVPAQFRTVADADGRKHVALDFNASPGPLETEVYTVKAGPGVEAGPEPKQGMSVRQDGGEFRVANGSVLVYRVPDRLDGFLRGVTNVRTDFLQGRSPGLSLVDRRGGERPVGGGTDDSGFRGTVTRSGPVAVGLRFEGAIAGLGRLRSTVDLTFPNSKSWVEASWTVDDPEGVVAVLKADLSLRIEGEQPLTLDFGANNTVYGVLRGRESMELQAGDAPGLPPLRSAWRVMKSEPGRQSPAPFALAASNDGPPAEGWAHVMDATRCTAAAVAGFGRSSRDAIRVAGDGGLGIYRTFSETRAAAPPPGPKSLRFWLHFVPNPVQIGAATSPQAMLAPLEVAWEPAEG